ncbi:hypothetical protein AXZ77_3518 [Thioclava sp. ES.031]|uniref:hypothetical protein n=1 Tax=Thioclava sp. ES.031 TaxID=1798203 RepID=UPI000BF25E27|nr:hypothetical protein [Thioclava sp. ES.031]PFG64871.1 hypothetical protein AXZ77_3518 [Thioclava sp. ES.031]
MIRFVTPFALSALIAMPAFAGAYQDAEAQLRKAYGDYRAALFLSNQGKQPETKAALDRFVGEWQTLSDAWTAEPPPQYADDAVLGATFDKVSELAAKAEEEVAAGNLPEAHETLEGVRESIGDLHVRNGIVGFSDRMNAYHAEMEEVLARDYAGMGSEGARQLIADASLLSYLAAQIVKHPAPEAETDMGYQKLVDGFAVAVAFFYDAAMAGDMERAMEMRKALKPSYAQLFAKFG